METTQWRRSTAVAGAAALVLVASSFVGTPEGPPDNASADAVRRYYETHLDSIGLYVTASAVGLAALVVFVVTLRALMRTAEAPGRTLTDLATAGGLLTGVWIWLHAAAHLVPIVVADGNRRLTDVDDATLAGLDVLFRFAETVGDLSAVPRGLFLGAVGLLAVRTRFLPRWTAYFGLFVAAASLLAMIGPAWWVAPFGIAALIGLFGFVVWFLLAGAVLVVRALTGRRAAVPDAVA